jgi:glutamate-1-semialdehyde 2,1-aminomutase
MKQKEIIIEKAENKYLYAKKKKYLDFSLSSGAMILGHSNNIFKKTLIDQLKKGSNYSSNNTNQVNFKKFLKKTFSELEGFEFSNSGSEANIKALRIARSISKKNSFAMVNGSWHGSVDQFMFDFKQNNKLNLSGLEELSSGTGNSKKDLVMLPYNNIKLSQKILDKNLNKISVVVIEPIQCGLPNKDSIEYLDFLIKYCRSKKILIWFDEIITGMRVKKLSIFKKYNLKPDLVTFAKCFGGGMPIGITSYNSFVKKKLSKLQKKVFFGGTFSGNPISTIVGLNTCKYLKQNHSKINKYINYLARHLEDKINSYCKNNKIKFRLLRYESLLRPIFTEKNIINKLDRNKYDPKFKKSIELKNFLLKKNIFLSANCCFFISYCHTKKDIENLSKILKAYLKKI